ncbi:MAG: DUF1343 domain-containing protein [Clostridia bacterium]|nr:DUF1343 domain-containing protein [Clostridia bacterium]
MKSCAEAGREVIVLDRPNPIRGDIVEGGCAEGFCWGYDLLAGFDYPLRHGMTIGELALMYNEEKKIGAELTVLPMENWTREMWYEDTGLVWLPPSPNMPTVETALYFAAAGLMQGSNYSLGIGTTTPFRFVGAPDFDGDLLADELNALGLDGVYFVQKYYQTRVYGREGLTLCSGVMMCIHDRNIWRPVTTQLHIMDTINRLFPEQVNFERSGIQARMRMGTHVICDRLARHESLVPVIENWQAEAEAFDKRRRPWLLY